MLTSSGRVLSVSIVALVGIATALGFLDQLSWVFEPATFFRLQYAVLLAIATLAALALRMLRLAAAAFLLVAVNVAAIAPWEGALPSQASPADPTVKIVAFNVNAGNHRYGELSPLIRSVRPTIVGLTELTPAWARAAAQASTRLHPRRLVPRRDEYGMGVLSTTAPKAVSVARFPSDGPITLIARFSIAERPLTFVLIHLHTPLAGSVHVRELQALAAARRRFGPRLVICGDFNTVPWSAQFGDFAESTRLHDVFQRSWPVYSWPSWSPLLRVPLDHCLVSDGLTVRSRRFGPSSGSDHFPLIVDLALTDVHH